MTTLDRDARAAACLDRLLWSSVRRRDLSVTAAVALAFAITDALRLGAFPASGSHANN